MPCPTPGPTPEPNLLRNADLKAISGWEPIAESSPSSLNLTHDAAGWLTAAIDSARGPASGGWQQTVCVTGGAWYLASYRVRTEALSGWADMRLSFRDAAGHLLYETGVSPASGDTAWTNYAWRCQAPAAAASVTVALAVDGATAGRASFAAPRLAPDEAPRTRALIVDYGSGAGTLRTFQQVSGGLYPSGAGLVAAERVRTHNLYGAADMHTVFPNPQADPADPASYDFAATDRALAAIVHGGAEVFFRLGESREAVPTHNTPGLSPERWAEVARHIVMHYNEGWANGQHYGIRYWEVWDGPDQAASWAGPVEEYYELLATTMRTLKAGYPELKVGGPALATPAHLPYLEELLAYLAESGLRPDFISWRWDYASSPRALAVAEARVEQLLERYGFGDAEVINSGWDPWAAPQRFDATPWAQGPYNAAHLAAAVTYWQDTRLSQAYRDWGEPASAATLLERDGQLTYLGQAFTLLRSFSQTPHRLATQGGDALGFTLLAGKSADGLAVQILVADTGSRSDSYRLGLGGFPPGYRYTVSEISAGCKAVEIAAGESSQLRDGVIALPWHPPAVHLIRLTW